MTDRAVEQGRNSELRKVLENHRQALSDELRAKIAETREGLAGERVSDAVHGPADNISSLMIEGIARQINEVDAARGRLEVSQYGVCFDCGEEIATIRLRAVPFATQCKACKSQAEEHQPKRSSKKNRRK